MKVDVVDVFVRTDSLDSERGILFDGILVLPDPYTLEQVVVRQVSKLSPFVRVGKVGVMDVRENPALDDALKNQVYNSGWFQAQFHDAMRDSFRIKAVGN